MLYVLSIGFYSQAILFIIWSRIYESNKLAKT